MNKGKIYYIINNLLDRYDNGEKIEEDMFIDTLVKIRDIVEENTPKSLLDENYNLQSKIDKAIEYYETHQQECVIGRNRDDKLIKDYYLPSQFSKKLYDILKEVE